MLIMVLPKQKVFSTSYFESKYRLVQFKDGKITLYLQKCFQAKFQGMHIFKPIALRKAKIVCNFGLSECNTANALT